ncbi:MAG: hypothetical protein IJN88_06270 [Clostridia bacterium]|nr:hypothetical protein [Clostridia bacterium]
MAFIKSIIAFMTAVVSLVTGFLGIDMKPEDGIDEPFRVKSYIVCDRILEPSALCSEDFDIITDVILFGVATFDSKGNVTVDRKTLDVALKNLKEVIGERDIEITLNFLGPGSTSSSSDWYEQMESLGKEHNKAFRSLKLKKNIIAVLEEYDFDGVHFDYEYPTTNSAWFGYNNFLVSLGSMLGDDYTLNVAASDWCLQYSDLAVEFVDSFELMMYDVYDEEGKHATFETVATRSQWIKDSNIPLEKITFGLPFYARPTDGDGYWYDYVSYADKLDENGFYTDSNISKTFWFNTPDVIAQKTQFAIDEGYAGMMIWHYTCDLPSTDEASLLKAIGDTIDKNS